MGHHAPKLPTQVTLPSDHFWRKLPKIGGVIGAVGIIASIVLAAGGHSERFYYSYLVAFMYCLSFGLGGLFFIVAHHATKTGWNVTVRRLAETVAATLPLFAALFIPVLIGLHKHVLFHHWTDAEAVARMHSERETLPEQAALRIVTDGGRLYVQLCDSTGATLRSAAAELRPLIGDVAGKVTVKLDGH